MCRHLVLLDWDNWVAFPDSFLILIITGLTISSWLDTIDLLHSRASIESENVALQCSHSSLSPQFKIWFLISYLCVHRPALYTVLYCTTYHCTNISMGWTDTYGQFITDRGSYGCRTWVDYSVKWFIIFLLFPPDPKLLSVSGVFTTE